MATKDQEKNSKAATSKPAAGRKSRVPKKSAEESVSKPIEADITIAASGELAKESGPMAKANAIPDGRYVYATGRRKTAVANVRIFSGSNESTVNKKPFVVYFFHPSFREKALQAFQLTGMEGSYYFTASILGGGMQAQAHALQHGLARALSEINPEIRTVLKRNGLLTRDDRKKERKKPGLKRARRSPQWAKR